MESPVVLMLGTGFLLMRSAPGNGPKNRLTMKARTSPTTTTTITLTPSRAGQHFAEICAQASFFFVIFWA